MEANTRAIEQNTVAANNQLAKTNAISGELSQQDALRILFVGNSITRHSPKKNIGWEHDWGMAASAQEKDYVHLIMKKVRWLCPNAGFCLAQMADWERQYWKGDEVLAAYKPAVACNPDIIILRIVENVPRDCGEQYPFGHYYGQLLDFLNPEGRSKMILTTSFWPAGYLDDAIRETAEKRGYPLVELGRLGEMDEMKAVGLFEHAGVAAHPGDRGMAAIADAIWERMKPYINSK